MLRFERQFYSDEVKHIVGIDEAGRGPLAGPVVAAAVVFPPSFRNADIDDSKKLTAKKRMELFELIKKKALGYGIAFASAQEIDELNIYAATKLAMRRAIEQIKVPYELVLTDAMPFKDLPAPTIPVIKGDAKALNIAAASILAKVTRDLYMDDLQKQYPAFSFADHKGYGTKAHMEELEKNGPIEGVHRKSYKPVAKFYVEQLTLF
ncbi:MAG: ribonuclease HII [Erysipelotrichaceae bacterium]|nr:ribonuclease HII [Erysipelotrichaceae bacterium]